MKNPKLEELKVRSGQSSTQVSRSSNEEEKQYWIALLLCEFLGIFGAHKFYLGEKKSAVIMLVLTLTFVGVFVTSLWALWDWFNFVAGNYMPLKTKTDKVVRTVLVTLTILSLFIQML